MELDMDVPLSSALRRKRKARKRQSHALPNTPSEAAHDTEHAALPAAADRPTNDTPPEILVSEFDYAVENHFKAVDKMSKLSGYAQTLDANHAEVKRFSKSVIFLREWRDFNYAPRIVRFACQRNSNEKDVTGEVILPQFSAASVLKKETRNGSKAGTDSSKDFVMHAGGAIWAMDWCPRVDHDSENHVKYEFVAVAAHPPESSYHKIGAPLTGRGAIQIWCLLTVYTKDEPTEGNKKSRSNTRKKGAVKSNKTVKIPKPRGRPRKKPTNYSIDEDGQYVQPLAVEYPDGSPRLDSSDRTSGNASEHVHGEDTVRTRENSNSTENANESLLTASKVRRKKAKAGKVGEVQNNGLHIVSECEHGESAIVNPTASSSVSLDSMSHDNNVAHTTFDANTSRNSIPMDVALPRMMLCLAHNGKVVWDVKWKPANASDPESMYIMGYLAVLLGNGALEVWEVPFPHTVKLVYPADKEHIDPRFIRLQPVFRCSILKCGNRQSIPITVEWSVSSPHDMILAGCHDGVVALWKFSVGSSLAETRPLLSFNADTGPIRTLAWAPMQSDPETANIFVAAGHKSFKFWDIRDPFRPLWDYPIQGVTFSLDWLPDPRCVFGSTDDGKLWLLSLEKVACDIPVTGKSLTVAPKLGFHIFDCSSFSIWSIDTSRLTGVVAYCCEEGTALCFQPTTRSVRDPSRSRLHHYLCGSLLEEESTLVVSSPVTNSLFAKRSPSLKRSGSGKDQEKRAKERIDKSLSRDEPILAICYESEPVEEHGTDKSSRVTEKQAQKLEQISESQLKVDQDKELCKSKDARKVEGGGVSDEDFVFPPKTVAMNRVRWNVNRGSEKWLCYGGAAGLLRCHEVDFSVLQ